MGSVLSGYGGIVVFLIAANAILWIVHHKSHYVTMNQLEQKQLPEAATYNLWCSQLSGSVSCGWRWHFWIPAKSTSQCKLKEI